jgi:hypothetical protein
MSTVAVVNHKAALAMVAHSLGLPDGAAALEPTSNALIAQSLRRSVFIAGPCSARNARNLVVAALAPLADGSEDLDERIGRVLEDLISTGDVLEMRRENTDGSEQVLRPAPPSFVKRGDGTFILLGVAGDEITPRLEGVVAFRSSGLRTISPVDPTACNLALLDLGLIELTSSMWMHSPATMTAKEFLQGWLVRLPQTPHPEKVEELEILDTSTPTTFYNGRWRPVRDNDSGMYLARRPQKYGAKLWSLVEVKTGLVHRLVDVHSKDARIRDCDEAWRIQAAFDACAGAPQKVGVVREAESAVFSFFSPLPAWAVRRLTMLGDQFKPVGALLGFRIPIQNTDDELCWLEETLWLARNDGGAG